MTTRSWRGVAAVAGLLGLLALVAFAAAGHPPEADQPAEHVHAIGPRDYLATIALIMLPVGAFLIFWAAFLRRAYKDVPLKKTPGYPLSVAPRPFAYIVVFFIVLAIRSTGATGATRTVASVGAPSRRRPVEPETAKGQSRTTRTSSGCRSPSSDRSWSGSAAR